MTARLILNLDDDRIAFPLEEGENVIGRKKACEIYVRDGSLSKFHARILRQGERLEVVDAGSRNGTLVNGDPITPEDGPIPVIDGDEIQCGKLRFLVEGAAPPAGEGGAQAAPPYLEHLDDTSRRWELEGHQALGIGSRSQNHVRLEGAGISRFHAEISPENGGWVVKDLGSRNGVFVNDEKVDVHVLSAGDVVKIGTVSLRYQVPQGSAQTPLGEILADPRRRLHVIAGLVVVVLLAAMFLVPGQGGASGGAGSTESFEERFESACASMIEGRHNSAQEQFKRLKEDKPEDPKLRNWVRVFDQVSRALEDYEDPLAFDWDQAQDKLEEADKQTGVPTAVANWVDSKVEWVAAGKRSYLLLDEGAKLAAASVEAAEQRKFKKSYELQRQARDYLEQVQGPLREIAQEKIVQAWIPVLKASVRMIQRFMRPKSRPPHWGRARELIEDLLPLTLKVKERNNLRTYLGICTGNMEDEELYRAAIRIVEKGEVEFHPQAIDFLRKIKRQSSIHRDAQAILAWLSADELVRSADQAFEDGRGEHAMRLLRDARDQHDAYLGDAARESIDRRVVLISQVMSRWERGKNLGTRAEALKPLEEVITLLEDQPRNFYRTAAQRQFDHIRASLSKNVGKYLQDGLRELALAFGDGFDAARAAEGAMDMFERVRRDPNHKRDHIVQIKTAVSQREGDTRFLYRAEKLRKANRTDTYEDLLPRLKLLKTWLPPGKKQSQASELYRLIFDKWQKVKKFRAGQQQLQEPK